MLSKRLSLIIISIILGLAILVGGITAIVVTRPNSDAATNEVRLFNTNLFQDGNTINKENAMKLADLFNNTSLVLNWQQLCDINNGSPIVFPMGTVPGTNTPIYWEVVYKNGDYITVWMTQSYLNEFYKATAGVIDSTNLALLREHIDPSYLQVGQYTAEVNYSRSVIRDLTEAIYLDLIDTDAYPILSTLVKSPQEANQTYQQGDSTYNIPTPFEVSINNSGFGGSTTTVYYSHHNGLQNQTNLDTSYVSLDWDGSAYNDKFWIPSFYEVYNTSTIEGEDEGYCFNGGYWNFSSIDDLSYVNNCLIGETNLSSCWLRSLTNSAVSYVITLSNNGDIGSVIASQVRGIRPAAHLSLSALAPSVSIEYNSTMGTITGAGRYALGSIATLTATPFSTNRFVSWTDSEGHILSTNPVYSFTVTEDITITANFADWISVVAAGGTVTTNRYLNQSTFTGIITLQPQTGQYIHEFSFDGSTYYTIDSWSALVTIGVPFCGNITYSASTSGIVGFTFNYMVMSYFDSNDTINLYLRLSNTPYESLKTYSSVTGISVTATYGGSVTLIGNNFEEMADTDLVTCVAKICVPNYKFTGWYNTNDMNKCLSQSESTNFTKAQIEDSQIVAVFEPINNGNISDDINNV